MTNFVTGFSGFFNSEIIGEFIAFMLLYVGGIFAIILTLRYFIKKDTNKGGVE